MSLVLVLPRVPRQGTRETGRGRRGQARVARAERPPQLLGEIAFFGGMTIVYKSSIDLFLYVVGSSYENEVNSGVGVTKRVCSWVECLGVWGRSWVLVLIPGTQKGVE